jgi:methylisocitrate lyase
MVSVRPIPVGNAPANYYFVVKERNVHGDAKMLKNGSAGERFRRALEAEKPLQIVGIPNALVALMAERAGYRAIYLSGAGVANLSFGLPDLAVTTLDNVLEDARRITGATGVPLLVDVDTGFGAELMIGRTVREMIRAGVAAIHMEDQVSDKRCGHRPGKALVSRQEMVDRITAAVDARSDPGFVVMARTDAVAGEGMERALERAEAYAQAGADMIFPEALSDLRQYRDFKAAAGRPVLANLTEFGLTPAFTTAELSSAGVDMALYPLSASRAMNRAALRVLTAIRDQGTQAGVVPEMMTRKELYELLGYEELERKQRHDEQTNG